MQSNKKTAAHALLPDSLADAYHKAAFQLDIASAQVTRLAIVEFLQRRGFYNGKLTAVTMTECAQTRYKRYMRSNNKACKQLELFGTSPASN